MLNLWPVTIHEKWRQDIKPHLGVLKCSAKTFVNMAKVSWERNNAFWRCKKCLLQGSRGGLVQLGKSQKMLSIPIKQFSLKCMEHYSWLVEIFYFRRSRSPGELTRMIAELQKSQLMMIEQQGELETRYVKPLTALRSKIFIRWNRM